MNLALNKFPTVVFAVVMLCWFIFAGAFLLRNKPSKSPDKKRDPASIYGIVLQAISYALVWGIHREPFTLFVPESEWFSYVMGGLAMLLAIVSILFVTTAVNVLGKEWSLTARVVEEHKLATSGPYRIVRHPIYTAMLGMLLATGIAIGHWLSLCIAVILFFVGTLIRMRSEERLLREVFGTEFDNYSQRVPAIIPGIF